MRMEMTIEYSLLGGRPRKFMVAAYESYETGCSIVIYLHDLS